jgi:glycosyltransferase involved in cell wall biosynthesis
MKKSIVTTCKGRLHHLKQTVPCMLQAGSSHNIVIVDYGDPDGCAKHFENSCSRIQCVSVLDNTQVFSPSRARNIGAQCLLSDIIAFVDGDVFLSPGWLDDWARFIENDECDLMIPDGTYEERHEIQGTCIIRRSVYMTLRGYDEQLTDWGFQDCDLYNRAVERGARRKFYNHESVRAIHNDWEERTQFYADRRVDYTGARNHLISDNRRPVNPGGYGMGKVMLHGQPFPQSVAVSA